MNIEKPNLSGPKSYGRELKQIVDLPDAALITRREAAALLGTTVATLAKWGAIGKGPGFVTLGHRQWVRYRLREIRRFIDDNHTGGGDAA